MLLKGRDEKKATAKADAIAARLRAACDPQPGGLPCSVLGPVACPISIIKGSFRFHIIIKAGKPADLHALLDRADKELVSTGSVAVAVDIDPMTML